MPYFYRIKSAFAVCTALILYPIAYAKAADQNETSIDTTRDKATIITKAEAKRINQMNAGSYLLASQGQCTQAMTSSRDAINAIEGLNERFYAYLQSKGADASRQDFIEQKDLFQLTRMAYGAQYGVEQACPDQAPKPRNMDESYYQNRRDQAIATALSGQCEQAEAQTLELTSNPRDIIAAMKRNGQGGLPSRSRYNALITQADGIVAQTCSDQTGEARVADLYFKHPIKPKEMRKFLEQQTATKR